MKEYRMDGIEFDTKEILPRRKSILSSLESFEDETPILASQMLDKVNERSEKKKAEKEKKFKKKLPSVPVTDEDDWDVTLSNLSFKPKKKSKDLDIFNEKKNKKKKKKNKGEIKDHKKDFEVEVALLKALQNDQDKFVSSLQKKYDQMEGAKSTARGVGKFTTDLIQSITSARSLSRQLVTDIINTKKTIADLDIKERKEFGKQGDAGVLNAAEYASSFLKEAIAQGRTSFNGSNDYTIDNVDDGDDLFDAISDSLGEVERDKEVDLYLKYEHLNPTIKVHYHEKYEDDNDLDLLYDFVAYANNGSVIDDYPLPKKTPLSVNKSTKKCKDAYGAQYEMIFD